MPFAINNNDFVYKIMLYKTAKEGVYVYFYTSEDAVFSAFDANYEEVKEALEEWGRYEILVDGEWKEYK